MEENGIKTIHLTKVEKHSGYNRLMFAEDLIRQLPKDHQGRNGWLLNYSDKEDAAQMRIDKGIKWNSYQKAAETIK